MMVTRDGDGEKIGYVPLGLLIQYNSHHVLHRGPSRIISLFEGLWFECKVATVDEYY